MLVLLSGIGPLIAWRRATAANLRRNLLVPGRDRARRRCVVAAGARRRLAAGRADHVRVRRASCSARVVQEFVRGMRARRAMAREPCPSRSSRWCAATGAATAATSCTSAWRAVRGDRGLVELPGRDDVRLTPGETRRTSAATRSRTCKPTAEIVPAPNGRLERIDFGAELRVRARRRGRRRPCAPSARTSRPRARSLGPVSRFFEGEATSEVGLQGRAAARRLGRGRARHRSELLPLVEEGDKVFREAEEAGALTRAAARRPAGRGAARADAALRAGPAAGDVPLLVSPLVTWIWLGAIIVFLGGLIALWPTPARRRRGASAPVYAARVGARGRASDA